MDRKGLKQSRLVLQIVLCVQDKAKAFCHVPKTGSLEIWLFVSPAFSVDELMTQFQLVDGKRQHGSFNMVWSVKLYAGVQSKSVSFSTVWFNSLYVLMSQSVQTNQQVPGAGVG